MSRISNHDIRLWLDLAAIRSFECDNCDCIHIPALESDDAKISCRVMHRSSAWMLLTQVELRASVVLPMASLSSVLSAEFPELKVYVECPDDGMANLIISHAVPYPFQIDRTSFVGWVRWYLAMAQQIIEEVQQSGLLGKSGTHTMASVELH